MRVSKKNRVSTRQVVLCFAAIAALLNLIAGSAMAGVKVFLLAGQSNMLGCGGYDNSSPPAPYNQPLSAVQFWGEKSLTQESTDQTGNSWVDLSVGYGYGLIDSGSWTGAKYDACFGPEVGAGHRLHELFPNDDIYLVKYAVGATNLYSDWKPDGTGRCYNVFKARVKAAMENLRDSNLDPEIAGMMWLQGASDSLAGTQTSQQYAANLRNFITTVRSDFETLNMPIVVGRYSKIWVNDLVRTAQETVPGEVGYSTWINTDDLTNWSSYPPDANHFNTAGQIELGIRFADALVTIPEPNAFLLSIVGMAGCLCYAWWKRR